MSLALQGLPLAAAVSLDRIRRADGIRDRITALRNDVAPLVLIAIIAVAAAVALIIAIGLAAAWLFFCQTTFGHNFFPTVGVPSHNASYYYFGCRRAF